MNGEPERAGFERMLTAVADEKVRAQAAKALKHVGETSRHLIVANGIAALREAGYRELASRLARLACEASPVDADLLLELCACLEQPEQMAGEIEGFVERVDRDSVPPDRREALAVALAAAYRGSGRPGEALQVLRESVTSLARGIELMAALYCETGEPRKAIDVLYERLRQTGRLTPHMGRWLAKSFDEAGNYPQALDMLRVYVNDPVVKEVYEGVQRKLGLVPDSERTDRAPASEADHSVVGVLREYTRKLRDGRG
ncbi:MAG: hypothetical protein SVP26_04100 [Chloroflexota bacterium]|nr:hypothetical protein [Chloroflexota bacterium]